MGALITKIAESRQLKTQDVKGVLDDAYSFAYAALQKGRRINVGPMELKLKHKPARNTGMPEKSAKVAAKPASKLGQRSPKRMFKKTLNDPESTLPDYTL